MNKQAPVITWLAFLGALTYAVTKSWDPLRDFVRDLLHSGKIPPVGPFGGYFSFGEDFLWKAGISLAVAVMMSPWIRKALIFCRCLSREGPFTEHTAAVLNTFGRWSFAACLVFQMGARVGETLFLAIFAAMLLVPEATSLLSSGFTGFIDALFFPGSREKKPPYTLKLARFYVQKQRWDEAEAEYARMLSFYPDQLEAWQESLRTAFAQGENADPTPDEILAKGLKKLRSAQDKEALFKTFNAREKPIVLPDPEEF